MAIAVPGNRRPGTAAVCVGLVIGMYCGTVSSATEQARFAVEDYFDVRRVTELALHPDGDMIAYSTERLSLEENDAERVVSVRAVAVDAAPVIIDAVQKAHSLAWVPGSDELAFLMTPGGVGGAAAQVFTIHPETKRLIQQTASDDVVTAFSFSPDGTKLAYVTRSDDSGETPYDRFFHGDTGVVTDAATLNVYYFLNKDRKDWRVRRQNRLWIKRSHGVAEAIDIDGEISAFYWSPDAATLSVTFVSDDLPDNATSKQLSSVGIVDVASGAVELVAEGMAAAAGKTATGYSGGEWLPGGTRMHIRKSVPLDAWYSNVHWTIVDAFAPDLPAADWQDIERGPRDDFIAAGPSAFYLQRTVNAVDALYRLDANGLTRANMVKDLPGAARLFAFSADFESAVFVHESLTSPPEIHRWKAGRGVQKISAINAALAEKISAQWREVEWSGRDGARVRGWLITPERAEQSPERLPLITFVHGGPGVPMRNEFAAMMHSRWPYPFISLAEAGIAVFQPNYRGTASFGVEHGRPESLDGEPVDDVVSGVDYLVRKGVADPDRLAIAGYSHGAWLAPMVMVRDRRYVAGSFAEGSQNAIMNYSLMPMYLNVITHDAQRGVSLYDDPAFYIDQSPDLQFGGLETAMLFEAGGKSLSVSMIGSQKAARRAGIPAEYVVYPKVGHALDVPRLQRESAMRNLDWFRFWLQGHEDPDPDDAEQYGRWRDMRAERCASNEEDKPVYCEAAH